jgi:hypothetical protein
MADNSATPFWAHGRDQVLEFDDNSNTIKFNATIIVPNGLGRHPQGHATAIQSKCNNPIAKQ